MKYLVLLLFGAVGITACPSYPCGDMYMYLYSHYLTFTSQNYPSPYPSGYDCSWRAYSVYAPAMRLFCYFDTTPSAGCNVDSFEFSPSGDCYMSDGVSHCGDGILDVTTTSRYLAVRFQPRYEGTGSHAGFFCYVVPEYNYFGIESQTPDPNPQTTTSLPTTPSTTTTTAAATTTTTTTTTTAELPPTTRTTTTTTAELPPTTTTTTISPTPSETPGICECGRSGGSRIVGGEETGMHEYGWAVGINQCETSPGLKSIFCGGTLISNKWVVSAAHCFESFTADEICVILGEHDQTDPSETTFTQILGVVNIIAKDDYDPSTVDNDIALLELQNPVTFNEAISPICLPFSFENSDFQGEMATALGWGTLQSQGALSDVLMEVDLSVLTTDECKTYSIVASWITNNMICTYTPGKDSCQGDSGGTLQWKHNGNIYLIGITSFGFGCGADDSPGVSTKVTNYLSWLEATTGESFCKP